MSTQIANDAKEDKEQEDPAAKSTNPEEAPQYKVTLQEMKDMGNQFRSKMRMQQEPRKELGQIITVLEQVAANQETIFADNQALSDYFFKEFISCVTKSLTQLIKIKLNNSEFLEQVALVPGPLARILAANVNNMELIDGIKCIFDHKSRLY